VPPTKTFTAPEAATSATLAVSASYPTSVIVTPPYVAPAAKPFTS
jgi:hypothetical protein